MNNWSDQFQLKTVQELLARSFYVPAYQRGYRWTRQNVKDLLGDIKEFIDRNKLGDNTRNPVSTTDFYCLQPLVVAESPVPDSFRESIEKSLQLKDDTEALQKIRSSLTKNVRWEVIDGQQRLTTIFLVLSKLGVACPFSVKYARWPERDLDCIIKNLSQETKGQSIDKHHLWEAADEINHFFENYSDRDRDGFKKTLLNNVQFIWYESRETDPIKVFTRLNIGKIGLTNAELIKALFLNQANFAESDLDEIRLRQIEIATRWDEIESTLQDDEFWLFLHDLGYGKPTRIEFLFDLMCKKGSLDEFIEVEKLGKDKKELGKDNYRTFRYFNAFFHSNREKNSQTKKYPIEVCWERVDELFATFKDWFDNLKLYHYIGFLIASDWEKDISNEDRIIVILNNWDDSKTNTQFVEYLNQEVSKCIAKCSNLGRQYTINNKRDCVPLLLLYNIQTVINQNGKHNEKHKDVQGVFYKFPFHIYKKEGWDVEHIDSNSENDLSGKADQNEFLLNRFLAVNDVLQSRIENFINNPNASCTEFDDIKKETNDLLKENEQDRLRVIPPSNRNDGIDEKNLIWNYALLDSSTNRSYGNAIFSAKRRIVIGKDQGFLLAIPRLTKKDGQPQLEISKEKMRTVAESSFVPPCTKQVFFKYYSPVLSAPNYWLRTDADAYRNDIFETLKSFGVTMPDNAQQTANAGGLNRGNN